MNKRISVISIFLIITAIICIVAFVFCIADFAAYYNTVHDNPVSDGIDYFMIGSWHGLLLAGFAVVGFVCSLALKLTRKTKFFKIYSLVGMIVFCVLFVAAVFVFYA